MGKRIGDAERPAAGLGALRGQVLHARDDGHRPQPRPQRQVGRGPGPPDRRRALRLRLLPPLRRHVRPHRARRPRRGVRLPARRGQGAGRHRRRTPGSRSSCCATWSTPTSRSWSATPASPFPQDPDEQLRGAIEAVFASWNGPRAIAYRVRERIAHDLGTAVNVQAMVFGNRDDNSGTGVGFTRDPATGAKGEYGDFLVNAQGEDVVAGIRNTEPLSALARRSSRRSTRSCLAIFARLEHHYRDMCDTEFTIEQGKLWMLQTRVGKRTGRAALRMAVDMVRRAGHPADPRRRPSAGSPASTSSRSSTPSSPASGHTVLAKGLGASPGRRRGPGLPDRRRRPGGRRAGREGRPGPQRDLARGRPRHAGRRGHPDRPGRPGQPRRRRGPRLGQAGRGRRRGAAHRRPLVHGGRHRGRTRATGSRSTARTGSSCSARSPRRPGRDAARVRHRPRLGRRDPRRATSACGPTPTTGRTPPTPATSGPRASACAGPSTCSWPRTACPSCAA